eukprot:TRINITY_DN17135_c0_g1_i3.p1 TRINITY_DN17135_c0_g1~~TRINITY_DN17135_c0_g1_i3.p1  ORF type:complete len:241 (-),score=45.23 TRINITY_DN17135_c0_g1_i3:290-1012(-)
MRRRPQRSTLSSSSAASDVYKRQEYGGPLVMHVIGWRRVASGPIQNLPRMLGTGPSANPHNDIKRVLFSEDAIAAKVQELGQQISTDYAGTAEPLLLVGTLTGSAVFVADLIRQITIPVELDFICASSYGAGTTSSGKVKFSKDLRAVPKGRDLLVVEDIVDTGLTMKVVCDLFTNQGASSVRVCTLLDKKAHRGHDVASMVKYVGFDFPDVFAVGYGVDYNEHYRQLPYIGELDPEVYA